MKDLPRIAIAIGIAVLIASIGLSAYWDVRGEVEITKACFESGGKSVTHGWSRSIYCNK